ncbi:MAG: lamin tail domain-containing protein, partial [Myxococcota bacterium]|nr:lamin tail domain-containing protein [Myxococcota bacterium]
PDSSDAGPDASGDSTTTVDAIAPDAGDSGAEVTPDTQTPDGGTDPDGADATPPPDIDPADSEDDATADVVPDAADAGPTPTGTVPVPGDLVITEIMVDPSGISDADGEWLEIQNTSDEDLEIGICFLSDLDNDTAYLGGEEPIFIPAGAIWVMGSQPDSTINGGVDLDLVYPPTFWLSNTADEVQITCLGEVIDSVVYDASSWPVLSGRALSLDPEAGPDAGAAAWCPAPTLYSVGNYGSPGEANPACPEPDTTIDDCLLVEPTSIESPEGALVSTTVLIYDEGVTDVTTGVDAALGLLVEAGHGPSGTDPSAADAAWSWQSAEADTDWIDTPKPDYDQYVLNIEAPSTGEHLVTYRVSLDAGATWTYCDNTGSEDGFSPEALGALTTGPDPCVPNPCQDDPAPFCEGDILVTNAGQGACTADGLQPACAYDQTLTDCAFLGGACDAGACQGLAVTPTTVYLVISVVMKDPDLVGDAEGVWFELANTSDNQLNLSGCELLGVGDDVEHVIDAGGALLAQPGDHLVLGRDGDSTINGGVTAHYVYAGVSLGNGGDTITIRCDGVVIDSVSWDGAYPDDSGAAMQLSPDLTDATSNDDIDSWCGAPQTFGDGDYGSPGLPNPPCYVDPCADVVCDTPPAPACIEGEAVTYTGGACVDGLCEYDATPTDCAADGLTCLAGVCITEALAACHAYCDLVAANCADASAIGFGDDTCLDACALYPSDPDYEPGDGGNSVECRTYHAGDPAGGDPATHCPQAGPDGGGVCVDPCAGVVCDDGLDCTEDSCVGGECSFTLSAESCLIEGACYGPGDANPADPCTTCQPANDANIWTTSVDGDACGELGETCQAGACLTVCEVLDCDDGLPCTADGCVDGACAYETDAAACLIEGACYGDGDLNDANPCGLCDPAQAQADWSAV